MGWPEAEEDDKQQVADCDGVVSDAKGPLQAPRAPGQAAVVCLIVMGRGAEDC